MPSIARCCLFLMPLIALPAAELAHCRHVRDDSTSASSWLFDGRGGLSASTDNRTTGAVTLRCRVDLPAPAQAVTFRHENALVSFSSSTGKANGSGLLITVQDGAATRHETPYLRITGEDWIESSRREWTVDLSRPVRRVTLELKLIDNAPDVAVRVDLRGVTISAARTPDP